MCQSASQRTFQPYTRLAVIVLFDEPGTWWLLPMAPAVGLEVGPRSVRRYITMLQDMGTPIEAVRDPGGGYRLRPASSCPH
jgi:predicted DNA-binding transcriptional regulator YafY